MSGAGRRQVTNQGGVERAEAMSLAGPLGHAEHGQERERKVLNARLPKATMLALPGLPQAGQGPGPPRYRRLGPPPPDPFPVGPRAVFPGAPGGPFGQPLQRADREGQVCRHGQPDPTAGPTAHQAGAVVGAVVGLVCLVCLVGLVGRLGGFRWFK